MYHTIYSKIENLVLWASRRSRRRGSEMIGSAIGPICSWFQVSAKNRILTPEHWLGCNWRPTPVKESPFHERLRPSGSTSVADTWHPKPDTWTLLVNGIAHITPPGCTNKAGPYGPGSLLNLMKCLKCLKCLRCLKLMYSFYSEN